MNNKPFSELQLLDLTSNLVSSSNMFSSVCCMIGTGNKNFLSIPFLYFNLRYLRWNATPNFYIIDR